MNFTEKINSSLVFVDTFAKTQSVMDQFKGKNIRIAYSGGADSDTIMWLMRWAGYNITGVFYDTGLEYQATKNHIEYMKSEGFDIEIIKPSIPIPTSAKRYGVPFISKRVSQFLYGMQLNNFDFVNDGNLSFDILIQKYPKIKSYLEWWCNKNDKIRYNIEWNKGLREFLIQYGLPFSVSSKCCDKAKKDPIKKYAKENKIDLMLLGIRKAEGGMRTIIYNSCYLESKEHSYSMYFPLFWWSNEDKELFDTEMGIKHSDAYSVYGLKRTGCAGCPFGMDFEEKISVVKNFEPKLDKAINNIFGKSYEWTRLYNEFKKDYKSISFKQKTI